MSQPQQYEVMREKPTSVIKHAVLKILMINHDNVT